MKPKVYFYPGSRDPSLHERDSYADCVPNETWRPIEGWPRYQVSNIGRIRRILKDRRCAPFRILKPNCLRLGYLQVALCNELGRKDFKIHRLVALSFLGTPPCGFQVNHKNGDKADNRVDNLEWVTPGDNDRHAYRLGLKKPKTPPSKGEKNGRAVLTRPQVNEIRSRPESDIVLSKIYGVWPGQIWNIRHYECWKD